MSDISGTHVLSSGAFGPVRVRRILALIAWLLVLPAAARSGPPSEHHERGGVPTDARTIDISGSAVRLALWEERSITGQAVPWYAISLDGERFQRVTQTTYDINLAGVAADPAKSTPVVSPELTASADSRMFIVQFQTQSLAVYRSQIRTLGGTIHRYLPQHAHLVEMDAVVKDASVGDASVRDQVAALPYVRWVGPYHPAYRLEPWIAQRIGDKGQPLPMQQRYNVMVFERGLRQKQAVADRIRELGGTIDALTPSGFRLEATLTPGQLLEVVRMDEVLFIDRWSEPVLCMDVARQIGGADFVESIAGYTGAGVRAEVCDNGFDDTHQDFQTIPPLLHGAHDLEDHGTNVYGIVFGDGTGDADARGLLPDAQGIMAGWDFTDRYQHTAELLAAPYFAVLQSNSWGGLQIPPSYNSRSAELDDILFLNDIVILHGQGNYGHWSPPSSLAEAWAKNVVSVGGVRHWDTLTKADDSWSGGGLPSFGPAPDGRIKPDLTHFYDNVLTTAPGDAYDPAFGGTSAATPITAGHFGLFFQMWSDGLFGNTVDPGGTVFDNRPHAATAKAAMINTASQYPFAGTGHDLTRMHQGWGMADAKRLYALQDRLAVIVDETDLLTELGSTQYPVVVAAGQAALRATLVYTDPAGVPESNPNRVNDLTLRVTSPSAVVYWGNNGLLAGNWSTSGGSANTIDTVENVFIENPEAGTWTVEVLADEINADGHPETPGVDDADYALVVSIEPPPMPADLDADWDADLDDYGLLADCLNGPGNPPAGTCAPGVDADLDDDNDADLDDFALFTALFGGP